MENIEEHPTYMFTYSYSASMQGADFSRRSSDCFDLEKIMSLELDKAFVLVFSL
jgi:hypothetical protein